MVVTLLSILSVLGSFPAILIAYKVVRRQHLSLFDVLAGAYTVNMCLFPLLASQGTLAELGIDPESGTVLKLFAIYFSFLAVIYAADYIIRRFWPGSILCFTRYIENMPVRKPVGWAEIAVLLGILALCWAVMLPRAHVLVGATEFNEEYGAFSLYVLVSKLFNLTCGYVFISTWLVRDVRSRRYFVLLSLIMLASAFVIGEGRRYFMGLVLMYGSIYYARNRFVRVNWLKVSVYGAAAAGLLYGSIIFFNVMRYTKNEKEFANEGTFQRLTSVVHEAMYNYSDMSSLAEEANKSRSMGLFNIIYQYLDHYHEPYNGRMLAEAISYSIPRFIHPQKSLLGSQGLLEIESGTFYDVADSVVFWGIGDWGDIGGIMAGFFQVLVFALLAGALSLVKWFGRVPLWMTALCLNVLFMFAFMTERAIESDIVSTTQTIAILLAACAAMQIVFRTSNRYSL